MTDTITGRVAYGHETPEYREKLAHDLHIDGGLPLTVVADTLELDTTSEARRLVDAYIARTDAAAAARQPGLFD
ncbi:hypothetical protein [Williamsia sterculiae]|uniref:Uncharacterized protein n=1 Tax=Williamsia sterculiae TaxID=1344003 RepID=A0A1N7HE30_9NOCA|nr:hypothetical protein [Williamsia sterculiae]SIS23144.1 hypothetical protein SAMN05445060_4064 [Williamsia sterculiae]